jgi:4-hydroxybenzoate polyprenyltransferase
MNNEKGKIDLRLHPLDLFFLLRPPMLIPVWAFFLAGYWRSQRLIVSETFCFVKEVLFLRSNFWISFILFSMVLGAVYIVNQIVDRESDRVNKKLFLIPLGIIPVKFASFFSILLVIVAFFLGIRYGVEYMIFLATSLVIGTIYSFPPFRLKGRPVLDILSNAVGYGILAFGIGWITGSDFSAEVFLYSIPYFFAAASVFTISTVLDIEGDREDGAITTGVKFGEKNTLVICFTLLLFSFIFAIIFMDWLLIISSFFSIPLVVLTFIKRKRETVTLFMRGGSYIFIILVGFLFPWFFILLIFLFFLSKFYYRKRFGINYPLLMEKGSDTNK